MCAMEWEQVKDESINECGNVWQCKWTGDCNEWAMTTKPCEKSHQCAYSEEQESSTDMRDKQNSRAPEKLDKSKEIKNKGKTESSNKNRKSNIVKSQDIKSTDGIAEVQKSLPPGFPEIVSVRLATEEDIRKHHSMRKVSKKAVL